ncbi:hypothetical protein PINS_up012968 [Pythium insidiosum]|nr:hypothetical protein PINS_up012968 [Pythium insidiosum]
MAKATNKQQQKQQQQPPAPDAASGAGAGSDNGSASPASSNSGSGDRSEFLKLFWTLAETDVAVRSAAAAQLITHLQQQQQQQQTAAFEAEVQYTLKRLVRGLASSRDAARQGFSAALSALLRAFPAHVSLSETLSVLRDAMEVQQNMKGMEQREHMFGKLFGLLALHRSGRLQGDDALTVEVVRELLAMSAWKKWLREACVEGALTVLADAPRALFESTLAVEMAALLDGGDVSSFNTEQVALAVGMQHYMLVHGIAPADVPAVPQLVRRKQLHLLAEPLKHSSACFPRVHSAWLGVFGHIVHASRGGDKLDAELLQEAWRVLVEELLLAPGTATHERKALALKLFELLLPVVPGAVLRSALLTPRFVKCLYNNTSATRAKSKTKKTYLHDAARHTLRAFGRAAPSECFAFLSREFLKPMPALLELMEQPDDDDEDDEAKDQKTLRETIQRGGFDAILAIEEGARARGGASAPRHERAPLGARAEESKEEKEAPTQTETQTRVLRFLVFHAFFASSAAGETPSKKSKKSKSKKTDDSELAELVAAAPEPALSATVRDAAIKKLLALLTTRLSSDATSVLSVTYALATQLVAATTSVALRAPLADEHATLFAAVERHVTTLRAQETRDKMDDAFLVLFMSCALQLLDASQRAEAASVVSDLDKCFAELSRAKTEKQKESKKKTTPKKKKGKKSSEEAEENEAATDPLVVLTDLLLSLLSQDSTAMREIVTHVFRDVLPLMNAASLETLVAALAPAEAADAAEAADENENEEDEDEDMEEEEDAAEEEEEEVVLSSAADIADALRDDAQLAELHNEEQALSAIVGQVKTKAKAKKDAKRHRLQVMHFKLRVLDLLAVYATRCAASPLVVRLVRPLFESLVAVPASDAEQRVLKERLQSVLLHKVVRAKEVPTLAEPAARDDALEALRALVDVLCKKALDKEVAHKVGAPAVVHLVRVLSNSGADAPWDALRDVLRVAVRESFTKKHAKFPSAVFEDLATRFPRAAVQLLVPTLSAIAVASGKQQSSDDSAADNFTRAEVFRLLSLLLKPKHLSDATERAVFNEWRAPLKTALIALFQQLQETGEGDDSKAKKDLRAKRLKVYLSFALHLVRTWSEDGKQDTAALADLVAVVQSLSTSSPVVKSMIKQLVVAAGGELVAATETPSKQKKAEEETTPSKSKTVKKEKATKKRKRSAKEDDE